MQIICTLQSTRSDVLVKTWKPIFRPRNKVCDFVVRHYKPICCCILLQNFFCLTQRYTVKLLFS